LHSDVFTCGDQAYIFGVRASQGPCFVRMALQPPVRQKANTGAGAAMMRVEALAIWRSATKSRQPNPPVLNDHLRREPAAIGQRDGDDKQVPAAVGSARRIAVNMSHNHQVTRS